MEHLTDEDKAIVFLEKVIHEDAAEVYDYITDADGSDYMNIHVTFVEGCENMGDMSVTQFLNAFIY